jgi:hypothetical protein
MVLTDEDITNFQELYQSEFNKTISKDEALAKGIQLLNLMSAITTPIIIPTQEINTN